MTDDLDGGIRIDDSRGAAVVEFYLPNGAIAARNQPAKPDGEKHIFQGRYIFIPNVPTFAGLW